MHVLTKLSQLFTRNLPAMFDIFGNAQRPFAGFIASSRELKEWFLISKKMTDNSKKQSIKSHIFTKAFT